MTPRITFLMAILLSPALHLLEAADQKKISVIQEDQKLGGWTFDNGREFPGAVGKLEMTTEDDVPVLNLHGDFSKGGAYVQAATKLNDVAIDAVSFDIKVPRGVSQVTTRLIDGTGQCHQLKIRLNDKGGWQNYRLPIVRYFNSVEAGAPMDIVTQYEKWSGANDSKWHQPAKLFVILAGKDVLHNGPISIRNVMLEPSPPKSEVATTLQWDDISEGDTGAWEFNDGREFPGAVGALKPIKFQDDQYGLKLDSDFSKGGRYVGMRRRFSARNVKETKAIKLLVRSTTASEFSMRLNDASGQTHQRHGYKFNNDGKWHAMTIDPNKLAGGEHWGGANDGEWHGSIQLIEIMLNPRSSDRKTMSVEFADFQEDVVIEATASDQRWEENFDAMKPGMLPDGWNTKGKIAIVSGPKAETTHLKLSRSLESLQQQTYVFSPQLEVNRGAWDFRYRWKSKLHSPDNSFHGSLSLNLFDSQGKMIDNIPLGIGFGENDWSEEKKSILLPANAAFANWQIELKKTYGEFEVDDLSATRLSVQPAQPFVESIRLASEATGNLFYPGDDVKIDIAVHTAKPLAKTDQTIRFEVRDYKGNVQFSNAKTPLLVVAGERNRRYQTSIMLPKDKLNISQFYELHVEVPQGISSPAKEFCGFAILPKAVSKNYAPEKIPFTIRNWDSRIREYFYLADRLGLRMFGVWGGWNLTKPYKPDLPGLQIVKELNGKWVTGTPASTVEREGFGKVTKEALREGMSNFLKAYADQGLAMIALGNEPHGTGQKVLDNVKAYRILYETVKAFDPKIHVIGTSVEPNEEYFKAEYYKYLDSYDFHIYEHYSNVRKTMGEYRALMKKYDAVKPIHSTELGLNSQGQARLSVAIELIKKCTVFFAEGGETVSWFTIQYPDSKGKARGQFGDAHCVFDCKFNNYNPRLDAITYYNMINAIAAKKFVKETQQEDGLQKYLFRDDKRQCLQILWNDDNDHNVELSLAAKGDVEIIRIDGKRTIMKNPAGKITVPVSVEPVLVLYQE